MSTPTGSVDGTNSKTLTWKRRSTTQSRWSNGAPEWPKGCLVTGWKCESSAPSGRDSAHRLSSPLMTWTPGRSRSPASGGDGLRHEASHGTRARCGMNGNSGEVTAVEVVSEDYRDADLRGAFADEVPGRVRIFRECDFTDADLTRAVLTGATFDACVLDGACLVSARLDESQWTRGSASGASFLSADLTEAVFTDADLANTRWSGALLAGTSFTACRMVGAQMEGSRGIGASFARCNLMLADLSGVSLRGRRLDGLRLDDAVLSGADFRDTTWSESRLLGATLRGAEFDGADLRDVDLGELPITDVHRLARSIISTSQSAAIVSQLGVTVLD